MGIVTPERRPVTTIYLYELAWILPSIAIPVGMLVALTVTAFRAGIHLPGVAGRINPQAVAQTPPFNEPGVVQVAPGRYEVRMTGQIWAFAPREIRVPAGTRVHFTATSKDVVHGLFSPGADVIGGEYVEELKKVGVRTLLMPFNVMLLPGQIAHVEARFDTPGEYPIICHEYCGIAHHTMAGTIIVEPRP
jgi:cytochrome c oxidase subunit 2